MRATRQRARLSMLVAVAMVAGMLAVSSALAAAVGDPGLAWATRTGGTSSDFVYAVAVDGAGNVYTTGRFQGSVDFDPGVGVFDLTSAGNDDVFVQKLDSSGNFVWATRVAGISDDEGFGVAVDAGGNVYTAGRFQGTADFDPGVGVFNLTSAGSNDVWS